MKTIIHRLTTTGQRHGTASKILIVVGVSAALSCGLLINDPIAGWVLASILLVLGGGMGLLTRNNAKRARNMAEALALRPDDLVWVYPHNVNRQGSLQYFVMLALRDGQSGLAPAKSENEQQALMAEISSATSAPVFGFTPERAVAYAQNPAQLR